MPELIRQFGHIEEMLGFCYPDLNKAENTLDRRQNSEGDSCLRSCTAFLKPSSGELTPDRSSPELAISRFRDGIGHDLQPSPGL